MTAPQTALLLGATGQTGQKILSELLRSPDFSLVGEFGRSLTKAESLPENKSKLEQRAIDFEKLEQAGLGDKKWDVVFIALGTTKKAAGSAEAFEKIDREYVINAARAAKSSDPDHPQRLVYVSVSGASSSSSFLYTRSKGLTEEGLASLGYNDTIVLRPAFLQGTNRSETRLAETALGMLTGLLSHVTAKAEIHISALAKSAVLAGRLGSAKLPAISQPVPVTTNGVRYTAIENPGLLGLAQ
ncbi:hypothetical protein BD779DRAFT_1527568 [Infundibulicybe gibba]|nr:hypothetical protein BD779DRAFT_1527568 [Infundibulicybe gibba]